MRFSVVLLIQMFVLLAGTACGEKSSPVLESDPAENSVGPPVKRSEVILTADQYVRLHWTMTAANRTGVSCGGNFFSDYMTGDRIGVGYKWGGWNDVEDFRQKIESGYGTGTGGGANTYANYSIDCVAGVSCTGLVSRAWHLNEKYTLCYPDPGITRKFCEITSNIPGVDFGMHEVDALKKGDVFINDYHTIIFVYETRDEKPMVMDSSIPGVRFRQITWAYLSAEGYWPIRYDNITDEVDPAGTTVNPIEIVSDDFPFVHDGNTRDVVSMEFDWYQIAPGISQAGPEVIYRLEMTTSATVTMSVTDVKHEGINNDIHLLGSLARIDQVLMASDSIARADNTITTDLDAGIYFIVVDSSDDKPGEYTLSVDFN